MAASTASASPLSTSALAAASAHNSYVVPSEISEFYRHKSIFITGATGFLGKALVEKLLRSCFHLDKIYLLVRGKKGKSANQRLDEIVNCKLFEKVHKLHADFRSKLVIIEGDLVEPNLGISAENRHMLIDHVNVVFHSAATVRFDEPLKVAVNMNIIGVKKVIALCKELKNLEVFVHISTAYANCDRLHISEEVYAAPVKADKLIEAVEWIDEDVVNTLTPRLIKAWPNTYTYTKAIAESMIAQECAGMPCAIVRPSIVGASWREPFAGWIDNFNGPTALFPATGTGLLRSMLGNHECIADIIPVDIPVNLMIAAAWYTGARRPRKLLVYNCTSGQINKLTWGMLEKYGRIAFFKNPFQNVFFVPNPHFTLSRTVKSLRTFFEQLLPAYTLDFFLKLLQKKPLFVRLQTKITKAVEILEYFTTKQWEFTNDNIFMLMRAMNTKDYEMFNFDIKDLNWGTYIEQYCLGAKIHLMKEDMSKLNECRFQITKLRWIQNASIGVAVLLFFKLLMLKCKNLRSLIDFLFRNATQLRSYLMGSAKAARSIMS